MLFIMMLVGFCLFFGGGLLSVQTRHKNLHLLGGVVCCFGAFIVMFVVSRIRG